MRKIFEEKKLEELLNMDHGTIVKAQKNMCQ